MLRKYCVTIAAATQTRPSNPEDNRFQKLSGTVRWTATQESKRQKQSAISCVLDSDEAHATMLCSNALMHALFPAVEVCVCACAWHGPDQHVNKNSESMGCIPKLARPDPVRRARDQPRFSEPTKNTKQNCRQGRVLSRRAPRYPTQRHGIGHVQPRENSHKGTESRVSTMAVGVKSTRNEMLSREPCNYSMHGHK
jgi:hypothetical protein